MGTGGLEGVAVLIREASHAHVHLMRGQLTIYVQLINSFEMIDPLIAGDGRGRLGQGINLRNVGRTGSGDLGSGDLGSGASRNDGLGQWVLTDQLASGRDDRADPNTPTRRELSLNRDIHRLRRVVLQQGVAIDMLGVLLQEGDRVVSLVVEAEGAAWKNVLPLVDEEVDHPVQDVDPDEVVETRESRLDLGTILLVLFADQNVGTSEDILDAARLAQTICGRHSLSEEGLGIVQRVHGHGDSVVWWVVVVFTCVAKVRGQKRRGYCETVG